MEELAHRAQLSRRDLWLLAGGGALASLAAHRRLAAWSAIGMERLPGMMAGATAREVLLPLPAPTAGQDLLSDYRALGLTLGPHPLSFLRARLRALGVVTGSELRRLADGQRVRIAGVVTHRQRPETASGVMFISLEDETGLSNIIVWRDTQLNQREAVLAARLMIVEGSCKALTA